MDIKLSHKSVMQLSPKDGMAQEKSGLDFKRTKIIVVGGHDKLHARLKKVIPMAVFIHPDRLAAFDERNFAGAEAVLFCTDYTSHKLFARAIRLARLHDIPVAHSSRHNIACLMDDLSSAFNANIRTLDQPASTIG